MTNISNVNTSYISNSCRNLATRTTDFPKFWKAGRFKLNGVEITINSRDSLSAIARKINDKSYLTVITAEVVECKNGYKLVLRSKQQVVNITDYGVLADLYRKKLLGTDDKCLVQLVKVGTNGSSKNIVLNYRYVTNLTSHRYHDTINGEIKTPLPSSYSTNNVIPKDAKTPTPVLNATQPKDWQETEKWGLDKLFKELIYDALSDDTESPFICIYDALSDGEADSDPDSEPDGFKGEIDVNGAKPFVTQVKAKNNLAKSTALSNFGQGYQILDKMLQEHFKLFEVAKINFNEKTGITSNTFIEFFKSNKAENYPLQNFDDISDQASLLVKDIEKFQNLPDEYTSKQFRAKLKQCEYEIKSIIYNISLNVSQNVSNKLKDTKKLQQSSKSIEKTLAESQTEFEELIATKEKITESLNKLQNELTESLKFDIKDYMKKQEDELNNQYKELILQYENNQGESKDLLEDILKEICEIESRLKVFADKAANDQYIKVIVSDIVNECIASAKNSALLQVKDETIKEETIESNTDDTLPKEIKDVIENFKRYLSKEYTSLYNVNCQIDDVLLKIKTSEKILWDIQTNYYNKGKTNDIGNQNLVSNLHKKYSVLYDKFYKSVLLGHEKSKNKISKTRNDLKEISLYIDSKRSLYQEDLIPPFPQNKGLPKSRTLLNRRSMALLTK